MRFPAHVTVDGALEVYDQAAWRQALQRKAGKRVWVELLSEAQVRSSQQNRYWWAVVVATVSDLWEREGLRMRTGEGVQIPLPKEVIHDALVTAFGGGVVETPLGKARRKSTPQMTVDEFSALIDATKEYVLHKYGVVIPEPGEEAA